MALADATSSTSYRHTTLPNGIRILTAELSHVRSASIAFYFGVGSRYESAEISGMAHFIEHMVFKGTQRFPTAQIISETIEGVGGVLDAATDKEVTVFSAKVASRHFDLAMDLLADMVRAPRFEPEEMEKERRVIIEEIGMYRDSPPDWVGVLADETFWPDMPLGREVAGTRETVLGLSPEAVRAFHQAHYVPGNLVISIVGDLSHERIVEAVAQRLGDWPARPVPLWVPCPPPPGPARVVVDQRKTEQTNIALLSLGISHTDPDYYPLVLLSAILGDGMSSRLFLEVREKQGLAYDISAGAEHYYDTGAFGVYAGVDPKRAEDALRAIITELARVREEPVLDAELTRAREYTKGRMTLRLENTFSVASWLGGQEILLGKVYELDEVLALLDAVTPADIQRVARQLFRGEWLRLAVIGPHKSAAPFERLLRL